MMAGAAAGGAFAPGQSAGGASGFGVSGMGGTNPGGAAQSGRAAGGSSGRAAASAGNAGTGTKDSCAAAPATNTNLPSLKVQLSNQYRSVTHAASGSLYGLAFDGTPTDDLIGPLRPLMFTQMAPNGQQLGNGATVRWFDDESPRTKPMAAPAPAPKRTVVRM